MPSRKYKTKREIDCSEVQGEGAVCILSSLTVGHAKTLFGDEGMDTAKKITFDEGLDILRELIISWNWVDDEDKPLPQVQDDPGLLDKLPIEEMEFLLGHLKISRKESKVGKGDKKEKN